MPWGCLSRGGWLDSRVWLERLVSLRWFSPLSVDVGIEIGGPNKWLFVEFPFQPTFKRVFSKNTYTRMGPRFRSKAAGEVSAGASVSFFWGSKPKECVFLLRVVTRFGLVKKRNLEQHQSFSGPRYVKTQPAPPQLLNCAREWNMLLGIATDG